MQGAGSEQARRAVGVYASEVISLSDSSTSQPDGTHTNIRTPLQHLRLRTPRLELRLGSTNELRDLGELFRHGTYPEEMRSPITSGLFFEGVKAPGWVDDFVAHHHSWLDESTPSEWYFNLLVFTTEGVVGSQGLQSRPQRSAFTNSLIGRRYQRQGFGTEARAAVLTLAFNHLGATRAISDAWIGNHASLAVSRNLGYVDAGTELRHPAGEPVVHQVMELDAAQFKSPVPVSVESGEALARWVAAPAEWHGSS